MVGSFLGVVVEGWPKSFGHDESYVKRGIRGKESRRRPRCSNARLWYLRHDVARADRDLWGRIYPASAACECIRTCVPTFAATAIHYRAALPPLLIHVEILPRMLP